MWMWRWMEKVRERGEVTVRVYFAPEREWRANLPQHKLQARFTAFPSNGGSPPCASKLR